MICAKSRLSGQVTSCQADLSGSGGNPTGIVTPIVFTPIEVQDCTMLSFECG
jgi:hypothetical protein